MESSVMDPASKHRLEHDEDQPEHDHELETEFGEGDDEVTPPRPTMPGGETASVELAFSCEELSAGEAFTKSNELIQSAQAKGFTLVRGEVVDGRYHAIEELAAELAADELAD